MKDPVEPEELSHAERATRVSAVIDEYLSRRELEGGLTAEQLRQRYPDLLPELDEALRRIQLIDSARRAAETDQTSAETMDYSRGSTEVRCPHCHHPARFSADDSVEEVKCSACNKPFHVENTSSAPDSIDGRFELIRCVGCGGFGAVWQARDNKLDREVAIKVPRHGHSSHHGFEDFLKEARIAAQLRHPHIVQVHEIGEDNDELYIVSDFIEGQPLDSWLKQHPITPFEAARLLTKVAFAVEHAHSKGVVHRDLKPANILMDEKSEPHITDFGLAKRALEDVTVTMDGRILGTPAYMSPEQAKGRSAWADARSDVYSLGVILFELLTEEPPFRGQMVMLIHQVVHEEPPAPRGLNVNVPVDLQTICLKCLEKDPDRRYQSAEAMAAELERFLCGEPILARPIGRAETMRRWCGRNPVLSSSACVIALLILTLLASGWWAYFDELSDRREIDYYHEQEDRFRQLFLQSEDFLGYKRVLEQTAGDPEFLDLVDDMRSDNELARARLVLNTADANVGSSEWSTVRDRLIANPARLRLQKWLENHSRRTELPVFAWFILDDHGLQLARDPVDSAFGRNYSWRTYFHGGPRDYQNRPDYLAKLPTAQPHIVGTYLSRALFTNVTHRHVVIVSTPLISDGEFVGVIGLMLELHVAESPSS